MTRRTIKQMTDAECIEAYRLNQAGEGGGVISSWGTFCSYKTAEAMVVKGERLAKEAARSDFALTVGEGRICEKAGLQVHYHDHEDGRFTAFVRATDAELDAALNGPRQPETFVPWTAQEDLDSPF